MRRPVTSYSLPTSRFLYFTVSTSVTSLSGDALWSPVALLINVVPISGFNFLIVTVWSSSLMSSWTATSFSPSETFSKATTRLPASLDASNVNLTSTVPLGSVGVNLVDPVTAGSSSLPVSLSIKRPVTSYSLPTVKLVYLTVSIRVTCLGSTSLAPCSSFKVVPIDGFGVFTTIVWPSSLISSWTATSFSPSDTFSKATTFLPASLDASSVNVTSTVPLGSVGVNLVDPVTAGSSSLPVSLSIRRPVTVYSLPTVRFV